MERHVWTLVLALVACDAGAVETDGGSSARDASGRDASGLDASGLDASGGRDAGGQDAGGDAGMPTDATVAAPDAGPTLRTAYLHPFASDAVQNTAIGAGAIFEAASATRTAMLHSATPGSGLTGGPTINRHNWSFQMALASADDPLVTLEYRTSAGVQATYDIRLPTWVDATGGTDRHVGVVQPDGYTLYEMYKFQRSSASVVTSTYVNVNDIRGDGLRRGSRASGISFLTGLIRAHEVDALDIPHTLALGIPMRMLKLEPDTSDGTPTGWNGTRFRAVWPARLQDTQSASMVYEGPIAMGSLFAIPGDVDLASLDLSPEGMALGRALQDYGAHVLLQANTSALFVEPETDEAAWQRMRDDWTRWPDGLFWQLRRVTNNDPGELTADNSPVDPAGVSGGGARRRPAPPPLREGSP